MDTGKQRFWSPTRYAILVVVLFTAAVYMATRGRSSWIGFPKGAPQWQPLQEGLAYRTFTHAGTTFHLVRADLHRFDLRAVDARTPQRHMAGIQTLLAESHGVAAVNGTFFDREERPMGWLVDQRRELNPANGRPWYGTLVVLDDAQGGHAESLAPGAALPPLTSVHFAIQAGPRTVERSQPIRLGTREAERTAACIVDPTTVILMATEGRGVEENWLARLMARREEQGGFGCESAMMFDGGPSTQLSLRTQSLRVDVPGGWPVPNAVAIVPRTP